MFINLIIVNICIWYNDKFRRNLLVIREIIASSISGAPASENLKEYE